MIELRETGQKGLQKISKSPQPVIKHRFDFLKRQKKYKSNFQKRQNLEQPEHDQLNIEITDMKLIKKKIDLEQQKKDTREK